jgi:hypothetical protein
LFHPQTMRMNGRLPGSVGEKASAEIIVPINAQVSTKQDHSRVVDYPETVGNL